MKELGTVFLVFLILINQVYSLSDFSVFNCTTYSCFTNNTKTSCNFNECDFIDFIKKNETIENKTIVYNTTLTCNDTEIVRNIRDLIVGLNNTNEEMIINLTIDNQRLMFENEKLNDTIKMLNYEIENYQKNYISVETFNLTTTNLNEKINNCEQQKKDVEQTRNIIGLALIVLIGYLFFTSEKTKNIRERFGIQEEAGKRVLTQTEIENLEKLKKK